MDRDAAIAEAGGLRQAHPEDTWVATRRGEERAVARIDLAPESVGDTATSIQSPPVAPRDAPYSEQERVIRNFAIPG